MNLTSLPKNLPLNLRVLRCNTNGLISLPENLPPNLNGLDCNHNQLTSLPDYFPVNLKLGVIKPVYDSFLSSYQILISSKIVW